MPKIKIITDSAADLQPEMATKYDIGVVPLTIRFGETEYMDRVELDNDAFWAKMKQSTTLPSTAAPSPGQFQQEFRAAADAGYDSVICICLSSKLSATYQNAVAGARDVSGIDVEVVDSQACALAQGSLCLEASAKALSGASVEECIGAVERLSERSHLYAALDTLDNLKKGGRIGAAAAFLGTMLSVKPIVTLRDGEVQAESRQRTRSKALNYVAQLVKDHTPVDHLAIAHSGASDIDQFVALLATEIDVSNVDIWPVGPVVGTHIGPGLIAVWFASNK